MKRQLMNNRYRCEKCGREHMGQGLKMCPHCGGQVTIVWNGMYELNKFVKSASLVIEGMLAVPLIKSVCSLGINPPAATATMIASAVFMASLVPVIKGYVQIGGRNSHKGWKASRR